MTIAIILVLISADRGEGLAKKVRQFSRGQAVSRTPLAIVCAAGLGGQCDQGCQLTDRASCIRKALASGAGPVDIRLSPGRPVAVLSSFAVIELPA
jgi:hypothetical protein